MPLQYLFALCLSLVLLACGSSKNDKTPQEYIDREEDQELAAKTGKSFYNSIIKGDTTEMYRFFDSEIDSFVRDIVNIMHEREAEYGPLDTLYIKSTSTSFTHTEKTDSLYMVVNVSAVYAYNEFEDVLYLLQHKGQKPVLIHYELQRITVIDCSEQEMEVVTPFFKEAMEDLLAYRDDKFSETFAGMFPEDLFLVRDRCFPKDEYKNAKISFHNGYLRQYCGTESSANGFLTFTVSQNDTIKNYITIKVEKEEGNEQQYMVYGIYVDNEDNYNKSHDQQTVKQLCNEIFRMLDRNDYKAFYNCLHDEARPQINGRPYNDEEMKEMLEAYRSWGKFEKFYSVLTFSIAYKDTDGKDEHLLNYVVIAQLIDEDDVYQYVELSFKPDDTGKIKLIGFEYM